MKLHEDFEARRPEGIGRGAVAAGTFAPSAKVLAQAPPPRRSRRS